MEDQKYHIKGLVKDISEEDGKLQAAVASSEVLDRMGEVVAIDGINLSNFKKNPILLWAHNASLTEDRPPIGKVIKTWVDGVKKKKLMFAVQFDMQDDFARLIYNKFKGGFLNAFSIGFQPLEREDNVYTKSELLEISAVPVPANPEALVQLKGMDIDPVDWKAFFAKETKEVKEEEKPAEEKEEVVEKKVVAYSATPTAPEDMAWDAAGAKKRMKEACMGDGGMMDWKKFSKGFAWMDDSNSEMMGAYKLPHHDMVDGELKTVWRGVAAAMGALLGARGGVDIPDAEKKAVYNHLKKHYEQFSKEPPEFRHVEEQTLKGFETEIAALTESKVALAVSKAIKESQVHKEKIEKEEEILPDFKEAAKILVTVSSEVLRRIKDNGKKGGEKNE